MNRQQVITEDYLTSGVPTLIAKVGVRALDQQTGILYQQTKVSQGAVYKEIGKYYYQPIDSVIRGDGEFNINFGTGSSHEIVTISQSIITGNDIITFRPTTRQEDFAVEQIEITVTSLSAGVGFEITAIAPSSTSGVYSIQYTIL